MGGVFIIGNCPVMRVRVGGKFSTCLLVRLNTHAVGSIVERSTRSGFSEPPGFTWCATVTVSFAGERQNTAVIRVPLSLVRSKYEFSVKSG